ncbi:hypothetical protein ACFTS5_10390 [Nocardia sp. NPDC056952]|uniref:hypothetical protein n=1 Tax=Nocardia sp. NPDC056952 TaxID=3345979 RepID=UPI00362CF1ED
MVDGKGAGERGAEEAGELLVTGLMVLKPGGTPRSAGSVLLPHPTRTIALSSDTAVAVGLVR